MKTPDPRLNAWRPDLADARLHDTVPSTRFAEGRLMQVIGAVVGLHQAPRFDARQVTQALMGERVRVFDVEEGWAWGQLETDRYVGYLAADALSASLTETTHRIAVPATFLYPEPNLKAQPATTATMNATLAITATGQQFSRLADGRFVVSTHLKPIDEFEPDYTAVAEMFLHVPYYWGGKSVHGLDCSGLVQLALQASGIACGRDSDMQERDLGHGLRLNDLDGLQRGDVIFWDSHVGIMRDGQTLLHANGFHMLTVIEPLRQAVARIAKTSGEITSIKRLQ